MKLNIEPESLVPKRPSPKDLLPFPTVLAIEYKRHADMVLTISTNKIGQYLLSGLDDVPLPLNSGKLIVDVAKKPYK